MLKHAADCKFLSEELQKEALTANANDSLGHQVEKAEADSESQANDPFAKFKLEGQKTCERAKKDHQDRTNLLVLELLCDACLAPIIYDSEDWQIILT